MKKRRASIDIGSNSVMLLVGDIIGERKVSVLKEHSVITGLGRGLNENSFLSLEAKKETIETLQHYRELISSYNLEVHETIVTATEAMRAASDGQLFAQQIFSETGFLVKTITSSAEAHFSALGVALGANEPLHEEKVLMDLGGASTELILFTAHPFKVKKMVSLPLGATRCKDWWSEGDFDKKVNAVLESWKDQLDGFQTEHLWCNAGIMTSWAFMLKGLSLQFEGEAIHNALFTRDEFEKMWGQLQGMELSQILGKFPFLGKRAYVLHPGLAIAKLIIETLGVKFWQVSTYGLRYGTLYQGAIPDGACFRYGQGSHLLGKG